tara:strand:- start:39805 stop:40611 length:807 start_codon:yes stop_codon:yes gene_type:complete
MSLRNNYVKHRTKRIGLSEVRASFSFSEKEPICMRYFARPLANVMTPSFYNLGITADQVIAIRVIIGVLSLIFFGIGDYWTSFIGLIAFALAYSLDCVDGNLSRLDGKGNYWGKFIDGYADDIVLFIVPLAIGVGVWSEDGSAAGIIVGAIASIIALITGTGRHRFSFVREWMTAKTGPLSDKDNNIIESFDKRRKLPVSISMNLYCFSPWLLLLPEGGWIYLSISIGVGATINIYLIFTLISQANVVLRRTRQAVHAGQAVSRDSDE